MKKISVILLCVFGSSIGFAAGYIFRKSKTPSIGMLSVLPGENGFDQPILALTLNDPSDVYTILNSKQVIVDVEKLNTQ